MIAAAGDRRGGEIELTGVARDAPVELPRGGGGIGASSTTTLGIEQVTGRGAPQQRAQASLRRAAR